MRPDLRRYPVPVAGRAIEGNRDMSAGSVALRLARENESPRYRRVHRELAALGITVAP
jgi:hypothetical protein